ncbi:phosphatidic acid phosphatase, putative [Trypanosoma cruzi marinkellei]|uniref:Phosphatidic acid phosphatase, putative n=1 Tax=Trypanosoma cruzi marinkellei TaxID=85056 RepID=K2M8B1_TRYCR|nr:phosphatidic acid phosphatase, putative [Trypanosoma cruzi marinkellei]
MLPYQKVLKAMQKLRLVEYLLCVFLCIAALTIGKKVRPYCRQFSWNDATIGHAYAGDGLFPSWSLSPIAILPALIYIVVELIRALMWQRNTRPSQVSSTSMEVISNTFETMNGGGMNMRRWHSEGDGGAVINTNGEEEAGDNARWWLFLEHLNHWLLAQAFSVTLTMFIVDMTKLYAGRLRPDFLARLHNEGYTEKTMGVDWCKVGREGRLSFPSGHSGISFSSIVPLVLFLVGQLQVFYYASPLRLFLCMLPLFLPVVVAVSRTRDNRHHFSDVLAGGIIGTCCAFLSVTVLFRVVKSNGMFLPRRLDHASKR